MLMLHAYRHHTREAPALPEVRGGLAPAVVRRVQEYLQAHLAEPVTLGELAREAGLSEYHFARMFGQSLGCPPHRYLLGLRLKRAKQLLESTRMTLDSITYAVGYEDSNSFGQHRRPVRLLLPGPFWQPLSGGVRPEPGPVASPVVILLSQITLRLWAKEVYPLSLVH